MRFRVSVCGDLEWITPSAGNARASRQNEHNVFSLVSTRPHWQIASIGEGQITTAAPHQAATGRLPAGANKASDGFFGYVLQVLSPAKAEPYIDTGQTAPSQQVLICLFPSAPSQGRHEARAPTPQRRCLAESSKLTRERPIHTIAEPPSTAIMILII